MNYIRVDDENFFVKAKAINIVGNMLVSGRHREFDEQYIRSNLQSVIRWTLRDLEKIHNLEDLDLMLKSFKTILRFREGRVFFMSLGGLSVLEKFYEIPHDEIIYNSLFCVWLLTYHNTVIKQISNNSLHKIISTIKSTRTHRIIRIGIAIVRNLAEVNYRNREYIVESNLLKIFPQFVSLKYEDQEFRTNLEFLQKKLEQTIEHMTSWPVYKDRILSGTLKRSVLHKDEAFWKTLIPCFGDNNFEVIAVLLEIINRSSDSESVAIALYHIKYFLKYHPASHRILNLIPTAKFHLMAKLEDPDPKVQLEALFAVQKLVLSQ
jgi:hypothetical protein